MEEMASPEGPERTRTSLPGAREVGIRVTSYRYRAARADGAMVGGVVEATSSGQASASLAERGLFPVGVTAEEVERRPAASRRDLAIVFQSIAALVNAGVPLERAVGASESLARGALRDTLTAARAGLHEGRSLGAALAAGRGVVPGVVLGMIRAGERGSQLGKALDQVATHLEQEAELVARVRQALAYPLLLAVAGTTSVLVIGTVVVPRFAELLSDLGQSLPLATRLLLEGSRFVSRFWVAIVAAAAAAAFAAAETLKRPSPRRRLPEALLTVAVLGVVRQPLPTAPLPRA